MSEVITIVAPIFALIALGFTAGRYGWVGPETAAGLANFTFTLAIPAMLFRTMAVADLPGVEFYRIWGAFFGSALLVWIIATLATQVVLRRPPPDGAPIAVSAAFSNVVMLGIPLTTLGFGAAAVAPGAVIVSLHSPLLWILATLHMAWAERAGETSLRKVLADLVREIGGNFIILAIAAGTVWRLTGLGLHPVPDRIISLLGQAAIPCALVALGLSLVNFRIKGQAPTLSLILFLKIVAMPVIAWFLAVEVFALPPVEAGVVVVFAAMPTGANAYLFAVRHGRAMNSASGAVALGTALSAITATAIVYWFGKF